MTKSANQEFNNFVKRQQAISGAANDGADKAIDWNKQRDEWLEHLNTLYKNITLFLKEYIDDGSIKYEFQDVSLQEDNIGRYTARKMIIHIGLQEITLIPIGTLLFGSKGRVDVQGSAGNAKIVLIDKDASSAHSLVKITVIDPRHPVKLDKKVSKSVEWTWKIASSPPTINFIELNKKSLFQLLMEVSNA